MRAATILLLLGSAVLAADKPTPTPTRKPMPKAAAKGLPESSLLVDSKGNELKPGKINLLGNTIDADQFLEKCKEKDGKSLNKGMIGRAAKVTGRVSSINNGSWTIATSQDDNGNWTLPVTVGLLELANVNDFKLLKPGQMISVAGICEEDAALRAWYAELLPPGVEWKTQYHKPKIIIAGETQPHVVECYVENTGPQPLKNIVVGVRLKQVNSPNDEVQKFTIKSLAPGQSTTFSVEFDFYNYQYIGQTSVPKGYASVLSYEL